MQSLKFLGKPAPDLLIDGTLCVCKNCNSDCAYVCGCRLKHLEGAIKEAAELIELFNLQKGALAESIEPEFNNWFAKTNPKFVNHHTFYFQNYPTCQREFVAFLLRKTISESTDSSLRSSKKNEIGERT